MTEQRQAAMQPARLQSAVAVPRPGDGRALLLRPPAMPRYAMVRDAMMRVARRPGVTDRRGGPNRIDGDAAQAGRRIVRRLHQALAGASDRIVVCQTPQQAIALLLKAGHDGRTQAGPAFAGCVPAGAAADGRAPTCDRSLLTLLFTDIVGSTQTAERLGDEAWHALLAEHRAIVREQLALFRGREIDNAGDGFFATFDRPGLAVRCAEAIRAALATIGVEIRAGLHCGECETAERRVAGVAVHVAARIAAVAQPGEILVSATVRELLAGSGLAFADRDWHSLKGLSGTRQLFALDRAAACPDGATAPAGVAALP